MKNDCLFCAIVAGEIPSKKVFEDDYVLAFWDINPQAPVHVIIVPKEHISCADDVTTENSAAIAKIFEVIPTIAKSLGLVNGYRLINNCGEDGGQTVKHFHIHLIGGTKLAEKII